SGHALNRVKIFWIQIQSDRSLIMGCALDSNLLSNIFPTVHILTGIVGVNPINEFLFRGEFWKLTFHFLLRFKRFFSPSAKSRAVTTRIIPDFLTNTTIRLATFIALAISDALTTLRSQD